MFREGKIFCVFDLVREYKKKRIGGCGWLLYTSKLQKQSFFL